MNILYLTQFFSSTRGGGPLIFYDLAKNMSKRGHSVHVICNLSTEDLDKEENIAVHIVKPYLKEANQLPPSMGQNLRYILNSTIYGIKIVKIYKIDIIHTNSFTPSISGSIIGKLMGLPVICTVYDILAGSEAGGWSKWADYNNLPKYYALVGRILEKISLSMPCDTFHTISKTTMEDIISVKPNAHISLVYPGVNIPSHILYNDENEYCDFILFIGRLVFYKKVDILIQAFRHLSDCVSNAKLVVVGDGPMKEKWMEMALEAGLKDSVIFLGNISANEKNNLLKKCSALALPSTFEGFGLVLLEAYAAAKPVLVSDVKPFNEIVDDGVDGFILPRDDPIRWSDKIQYLLLNKTACKTMGRNGLPKAHNKFSFEGSMQQMELIYQDFSVSEGQRK
jgi:glycosyltransferase involved in cell wall biosynthesis